MNGSGTITATAGMLAVEFVVSGITCVTCATEANWNKVYLLLGSICSFDLT
jgi:hypothetical protein